MKLKQLVFGMATLLVPAISNFRAKGTGGTDSARYCYSVWLRHLIMIKRNGLDPYPKVIAELGPGDSLGIGLAALISGSDKYFAFDVIEHADVKRNLAIFDELVMLFKDKAPIPGDDEFPEIKPRLDKYEFPTDIFDDNRLKLSLDNSRLEKIRDSILKFRHKDSMTQYRVPWYDIDILEKESVDMIYSQAVLEHVDDLKNTYKAMYLWLKPTGCISHAIDFRSHGTADEWNGHWLYPDFLWKLLKGNRLCLLNREPHSTHIQIMAEERFKVISDIRTTSESKFTQNQLASKFRSISNDDLVTSGAFIQGVKNSQTISP